MTRFSRNPHARKRAFDHTRSRAFGHARERAFDVCARCGRALFAEDNVCPHCTPPDASTVSRRRSECWTGALVLAVAIAIALWVLGGLAALYGGAAR